MTLSRQLILLVAALVGTLFLGTLVISLHNARGYLESQMGSHAQDAATSLGLSATAHVDQSDQAMVTAMVNAMFHRGDYLSIRFEDLQGEAWIERVADLQVDEVPRWFVSAFALDPPERSATMMSGWRQVGRVVVKSHPRLAHQQLWQTAKQMLSLFLVVALLVMLGGLVVLRLLLSPLKAVERQAESICEREFPVVQQRPFTLEFRRVVDAMNRLSSRVSRMLSDAERTAAQLRRQAFQDPVTGLANRRQFMDVLEHRVADAELSETGGLLLLQIKDLKAYNQARGYAAGDRLLSEVGQAIAACLDDETGSTPAHLSGADFAVLLNSGDEARLRDLGARIIGAVAGLYGRLDLPSSDVAHLGGVVLGRQSASELLAEADMALREAQCDGANAWVVRRRAASTVDVRSGSAWRALIEQALNEDRFTLVRQPVVGCGDDRVHHHEVFLRIPDPDRAGAVIPAAVFIPMAESSGLAVMVDKAVAGRVLASLEDGSEPGRVAMNLSVGGFADDALLSWFADRLQRAGEAAPRLILELPEYGVAANVERLNRWIERLRPFGVEFSLDHFGKGFSSFAYLRAIDVRYLKVDGSFVRNLDQQEDNRFFLRTIADIAHGLDMEVIAESVETEAAWQAAKGLGLDAGRGIWLGEPR